MAATATGSIPDAPFTKLLKHANKAINMLINATGADTDDMKELKIIEKGIRFYNQTLIKAQAAATTTGGGGEAAAAAESLAVHSDSLLKCWEENKVKLQNIDDFTLPEDLYVAYAGRSAITLHIGIIHKRFNRYVINLGAQIKQLPNFAEEIIKHPEINYPDAILLYFYSSILNTLREKLSLSEVEFLNDMMAKIRLRLGTGTDPNAANVASQRINAIMDGSVLAINNIVDGLMRASGNNGNGGNGPKIKGVINELLHQSSVKDVISGLGTENSVFNDPVTAFASIASIFNPDTLVQIVNKHGFDMDANNQTDFAGAAQSMGETLAASTALFTEEALSKPPVPTEPVSVSSPEVSGPILLSSTTTSDPTIVVPSLDKGKGPAVSHGDGDNDDDETPIG